MNPIFIAVLVLLGILVAGLIGLRLDLVTCDGRTRMSSMGVRAILERAGYSEVRRVEVDDGCYAALARDKGSGLLMRVKVDPRNGQIVSRRWAFME